MPLSWYSKACMNWRLRNYSVNIQLGQLIGFTDWQCLPRAIWRLIPVFNGCMVAKHEWNCVALALGRDSLTTYDKSTFDSRWWCWHWCMTLCQRDHIVHECMLTVIGPQERAEQQGTIWDKSCSKSGFTRSSWDRMLWQIVLCSGMRLSNDTE